MDDAEMNPQSGTPSQVNDSDIESRSNPDPAAGTVALPAIPMPGPYLPEDTPLRITCRNLSLVSQQRALTLSDLQQPLGLSLDGALIFQAQPEPAWWITNPLYRLPRSIRIYEPQELQAFQPGDNLPTLLPKLAQFAEELRRLQRDVSFQAKFAADARVCLERLYGGSESFASSVGENLQQHSKLIDQLQKVVSHLVRQTFPQTETRFERFA